MSSEWKTLRVVVEIKVRGQATESDLRWAVLQRLMGRLGVGIPEYLVDTQNRVGTMQVKRGSKVIAAERLDARRRFIENNHLNGEFD